MHTKRFNTFFKRWVPFNVGPRLPTISILSSSLFSLKPKLINHDQLFFKILIFFLSKLIKRKYIPEIMIFINNEDKNFMYATLSKLLRIFMFYDSSV